MKPIFFIVLAVLFMSCAGLDVKGEADNTAVVKVEKEDGTTIDLTCHIGLKSEDGIVLDSECVGFFEENGNTYRCSVAVNSDKQPVTKKLNIKENCKIEISAVSKILTE